MFSTRAVPGSGSGIGSVTKAKSSGTGAPRGRRIWRTAASFSGRRPEALAGAVAEGDGEAAVGWTDIGDS
ncbi:hypothetical protein [Streptomyces albidoflavus]|uniref:hypothetical protein n=1 Tax=Streptomyces albidoflavus TaxID=1886 RepID=UPI001F5D5DBD|nr:hypothetical protein [Streptomyces albidoflavus]